MAVRRRTEATPRNRRSRPSRLVDEQAAFLKKPPKTYDEVLDVLARTVPESAGRLRDR